MPKPSRWIAFCALAGLSACAPPPPPADVNTRWIGFMRASSSHCPAAPATTGWTVRPLFPLSGLSDPLTQAAYRAELDRFCVYEFQGAEPRPELPSVVRDQLAAAAPDKMALTTSAVPNLHAVTRDPFQQRFFDQAEIPTGLPAAPAEKVPGVRLSFLDTEATTDDLPVAGKLRRSDHGYTLIQIAGHLAGGQGGSGARPVHIAPRLAMPLVRLDPVLGREVGREESQKYGGFRGTFLDLSTALWEEMVAWDKQPEPRRLVLNLSLGWDGEKFGGWETAAEQMSPEVRAIHQVLEVAACKGILVIAAAGNERPGPDATRRPMLPAGWESRGPVTERGCRPQPLAYAVSGVDGRNHPLVNTRAKGEAPRVAYADHVVVPQLQKPGEPTATLTGTSVAAAVVSATAALVWQYRPDLEAHQVMELLARAGKPLPRKPDFASSADEAQRPVRRIALCPALVRAGVLGSSACPLPPSPPALKQKLSLLRPDRRIQRAPSSAVPAMPVSLQDQAPVGPQPGENPCPNCTVTEPPDQVVSILGQEAGGFVNASLQADAGGKNPGGEGGYRLWIEIPSVWPGGRLQRAALEVFVFDEQTGRKKKLPSHCPIDPLGAPGETLEVTCSFDDIAPGTPFQASLSFILDPVGGGPSASIASPLFVEY